MPSCSQPFSRPVFDCTALKDNVCMRSVFLWVACVLKFAPAFHGDLGVNDEIWNSADGN